MILLELFLRFFKVGLFSVGGGLATIPFLKSMGDTTGWFSAAQLADMIAVSESTPGPIGVNMASYVGFILAGPVGCVIATLGLVAPSIIIILIIAKFLQKFRNSRAVDAVFYGLRPASTGLIAAAGLSVAKITLLTGAVWAGWASAASLVNWPALILFAVVFFCMRFTILQRLHPVLFIAASAIVGILLEM